MRRENSGFTLLEVMIAMSILALGATSILSVFVAAVSFQTERVEANRITELRNWARQHAQMAFDTFDPSQVEDGEKPIPSKITVDLTDPAEAANSTDPMVRSAVEKFPGFRYEILFEEDRFSVAGSSVVAHIRIYRLSGQLDESELVDKEFLTRNGVPYFEYFEDESEGKERKDAIDRLDPKD